MSVAEKLLPHQAELPQPGTIEHLEFLSSLEIPPATSLQELQAFLIKHQVAESLASLVCQHSNLDGLFSAGQQIFDSRAVTGYGQSQPFVRAALYHYESKEAEPYVTLSPLTVHTTLAVHGRPWPHHGYHHPSYEYPCKYPFDLEMGCDYTYDMGLSLNGDHSLDTREFSHLNARLAKGVDMRVPDKKCYNRLKLLDIKQHLKSIEQQVYRTPPYATEAENDPVVFFVALSEAARDLSHYLRLQQDQGSSLISTR